MLWLLTCRNNSPSVRKLLTEKFQMWQFSCKVNWEQMLKKCHVFPSQFESVGFEDLQENYMLQTFFFLG